MRKLQWWVGAALLAGSSAAPAVVAGASTKVTKAPITIAMIGSTTGVAGPEYVNSPQGFYARIALQNAQGGVDGHKLVPVVINDAGNFSQEASIVQEAVQSKDAFGLVAVTPFLAEGYRWLQQNGIPVTGSSVTGPEWQQPQNNNMFQSDTGGSESAPTTQTSKVFKLVGGSHASIAALGYGVSPLSAQAAKNDATAAEHAGLKAPYVNTSVTFGATDFTAEALAIKSSGANVVVPNMDDNSNFALIQDVRDTGSKAVGLMPTGLAPTAIGSPSWSALQGSYFTQTWVPAQLHTKGTEAMQAALLKYEHVPTKTFPSFSVYESWLGATLMIKGLLLDGPNPTRPGVIAKLRKVTSYTGGGLLPHPIDFATIQKKPGPTCGYVLKAVPSGFSPVDTKPICGTVIPGTSASS